MFFFFFFFFFFSDECCPQCDLEKINHCVNGVEPVSIYRDWLASLFQSFFFFFSCNIHMHTDIHTCRHTNIYVYTCNMHLHVCMQSHKHFCLSMHYTLACMHTLLYTFLSNTHMQCHAHNIFFSVNMCNIYS